MKKCSKCGIEKEPDQYSKYWHSTQNTFRIRGYCKTCFSHQQKLIKQRLKERKIIQPVEDMTQPEPIIDYINNKDYKQCPNCKEWKYKDQYYVNTLNSKKEERIWGRCKPCQKIYDKEKSYREMIQNGGPQLLLQKPNCYSNDYQREITFKLMQSMGWKFNEEKGIWWKEGIKTEQGVFINIVDKKQIQPKIPTKYDNVVRHKSAEHSKEIYELRKQGHTLDELARDFKTSPPTIMKIIRLYEKTI